MSQRMRKYLTVALLSIPAIALTTVPAQADQFTCDAGEVCLWENHGMGGGIFTTGGNYTSYGPHTYWGNPPNNLDNSVTGWDNYGINSGPTVVHGYLNNNYGGGELWSGGIGSHNYYLSGVYNDNTSSHRWLYS